ncbi:MAG: winged helix-turn-helix transcriptional regulator [Candidatus Micrarchaeota archaeon]
MVRVDSYDRAVLNVLLRAGHMMTTNDIAERAGMSWNTADKSLNYLYRYGLVLRSVRGSRIKRVTYWRINR